jgi:hypothetical protein
MVSNLATVRGCNLTIRFRAANKFILFILGLHSHTDLEDVSEYHISFH